MRRVFKVSAAVGALVVAGLIVFTLLGLFVGRDAAKTDPQEVFRLFVQDPAPASVKVLGASGHLRWSGVSVTICFTADRGDLAQLLKAKKSQKTDSVQKDLFRAVDWSALKAPIFYAAQSDRVSSAMLVTDEDMHLVDFHFFQL